MAREQVPIKALWDQMATLTAVNTAMTTAIGALTDAFRDFDALQKNALSVGTTANSLRENLGGTLKDLPGGMMEGLKSATDFMQAGLRKHSKGMLFLANQAKVTGQGSQKIVAGFAKLSAALPMTAGEMGDLGDDVLDLSRTWGVKSTALMEVLTANTETIGKLAAMGVPFTDTGGVIAGMVAKVGQQFSGSVGDLAKQITFGEGFEDVVASVIKTGDSALVAQMRSGKVSEELLTSIMRSTVDQFHTLTAGAGNDRAVLSTLADIFGFNMAQISQFEAMLESLETTKTLAEMSHEEISAKWDESLSVLIQEISGPLKMTLIPMLTFVTKVVKMFEEWGLGTFVKHFAIWGAAVLALLTASKALDVLRNATLFKMQLTSAGTPWGLIAAGVLAVGTAVYDLATQQKDVAEEEERRDRHKRGSVGSRMAELDRTLTGARMAVQMSLGNQMIPDFIVDFTERVTTATERRVQQHDEDNRKAAGGR